MATIRDRLIKRLTDGASKLSHSIAIAEVIQEMAGEDSPLLEYFQGNVPTYADLAAETPTLTGQSWYVEADGRLYVWDGSAFPAEGYGIRLKGEDGEPGVAWTPASETHSLTTSPVTIDPQSYGVKGGAIDLTVADGDSITVQLSILGGGLEAHPLSPVTSSRRIVIGAGTSEVVLTATGSLGSVVLYQEGIALYGDNPVDVGATEAMVRETPLTGLTTGTAQPIEATDELLVALANLQAQISAAPFYTQTEVLDDGTLRTVELHDGADQLHGPGGSLMGVVVAGDTVELEVTYIGGGGDPIDGSPFVGPAQVSVPIIDLNIATITIQRTAGSGTTSTFAFAEANAFQVMQYIGEEQSVEDWEAGTSTIEGPVSPEKIAAAIIALAPESGGGSGAVDIVILDEDDYFTGTQVEAALQELGAALISDTGTGALVRTNTPTLVTPILGTPTSVTLTNATGLPVAGIVASTSTALGVGSVELGHATDTTLARSSAGVVTIEGVEVVTLSRTQTLTNKTLTAPTMTAPVLGTPASGNLTNCALDAVTLETCLALTPASYAWQRRFVTTANSGAVKINAEFFCDGTIWQPVSNYLGFINNTPSSVHTGGTSDSGTLMTITIPRALVLPGYEMRVRGDITKVGTAGALTGRCNFNGTQCYSTTGSAGNLGALPGTHIRVTSSTVQRSNGPGSGNEQDIRASYTFTAHAVNLGTTDPVFTFTLQLADGADSGQYLAAYVDLIRRAVQ